ncbi:acetylcholinesterase collagenic tail peptide-like [Mugil cephalus]|uniref:acetylcholinesterase collagenic tail peptide-like n=1 Tax=Mugil cephalus TaxID=48193 RepID=UPI001FB7D057|nr:acetylcholinesterase collagenic tail peptide-like [Mugil cephalus]
MVWTLKVDLFQGDTGQWGDAGPRGEPGLRGKPGGRGTVGLKGSGGPTGQVGQPGPAGFAGLTGEPGLHGQVFVLPGQQGDSGSQGPPVACSCSRTPLQMDTVQTIGQIFIADNEKEMRRLRAENVMVLRTDRKTLYIYAESQWVNILEVPQHQPNSEER